MIILKIILGVAAYCVIMFSISTAIGVGINSGLKSYFKDKDIKKRKEEQNEKL